MDRYRVAVVMFSYEAGGRPVMPQGSGYAPHACREGGGEFLPIRLHDVPQTATFDEEFVAVAELLYPGKVDYSAIMDGKWFNLVEGPKSVGRARIVEDVRS